MDKKYAKRIAAIALLSLATVAVTVQAAPVTACAGTGGTHKINDGKTNTSPSTVGFLQQGFDMQCSMNVLASYDEVSASLFAVAGGSLKGNSTFVGSSNGGSTKAHIKCAGPNDACIAADVTTAIGYAATM